MSRLSFLFRPCGNGEYRIAGYGDEIAKEIKIPGFFKNLPVRVLGNEAFADFQIESVFISACITHIGNNCFDKCENLATLRFEEGSELLRIGDFAFQFTALRKVIFPRNLEEIGFECFGNCYSLSEVVLEAGSKLKKIGSRAFVSCALAKFDFPTSIEELGDECFADCTSLREVMFLPGTNLKTVGRDVFAKTSITSCKVQSKGQKDSFLKMVFNERTGRSLDQVNVQEMLSVPTLEVKDQRNTSMSDLIISLKGYTKIRSLGRGGNGEVFLYQKGASNVAVKFMDAKSESVQRSFDREIENIKSLWHPCVVHLHGYGIPTKENENKFVIMMEYVPGGSLSTCLKYKPAWLDDTHKLMIIYGIAAGMAAVHELGIVHRDLKPGNVLLRDDHTPVICDFGSSRVISGNDSVTTNPGMTLRYMAPEWYKDNHTINNKFDVYSFAIMLYEIVEGHPFFANMNMGPFVLDISTGMRDKITDSVTDDMKELITESWDQDPEHRPSFNEICNRLVSVPASYWLPKADNDKFMKFVSSLPAPRP